MKKLISFCVACLLLLGLCACQEAKTPTPSTPVSTPSTPMNTPEIPVEESPFVTYSPYVITTFSREQMGTDYSLYCDLVDALLNYDFEIYGFESESQFHGLWCTLRQEFPPAEKLCADFGDSDTPYTYSNGTVRLKFLLDQDTHMQVLKTYAERIQKDLSVLVEEDTEVEQIAKLYSIASTSMAYGESNHIVYDSIMNNQGICGDYAEYLIVLLNQIGVECYYAVGYGEGVEAHAWVVAKMDGEFYHFDPTWQKDFVDGFWFAIDDELRRDSLLTEWKYAHLAGAGWESVKGDHVTMESRICWLTHEKIPLPACPTAYQKES